MPVTALLKHRGNKHTLTVLIELVQECMRKDCRLGAIAQRQLIENARHMIFYCPLRNIEPSGNLAVAGTSSNESQDFLFSRRQVIPTRWWTRWWGGNFCDRLFKQPWSQVGVTLVNSSNRRR